MGSNKGIKEKLQSMAAESDGAAKSKANTMPTYHKDKHAPNRPSI